MAWKTKIINIERRYVRTGTCIITYPGSNLLSINLNLVFCFYVLCLSQKGCHVSRNYICVHLVRRYKVQDERLVSCIRKHNVLINSP